jgi:hypothetical protein
VIGHPARDTGFAEEAARIVGDWRATMAPLLDSDTAPPRVERLCAEVTRALPPDGVLVADTGYSGIWTGTMIELNAAGQTYLRAAGSLGWSFPASLGAKCGGDRPKGRVFHRGWRVSITTSRNWRQPAAAASPSLSSSTTIPVWPEPDRGVADRRQSAAGERSWCAWPDRFHRGG